jgi:hypothetical protein
MVTPCWGVKGRCEPVDASSHEARGRLLGGGLDRWGTDAHDGRCRRPRRRAIRSGSDGLRVVPTGDAVGCGVQRPWQRQLRKTLEPMEE